MRRYKPRVRLLPYKQASASARAVARGAGLLRIVQNTRFIPRDGDLIVNWGHHGPLPGRFWMGTVRYLNYPHRVAHARDKREALRMMHDAGVPAVEFTVDIAEAQRWFDDGYVVVQRNTATGQGGAGIVVCDPTLTVNVAPSGDGVLWTKYFTRKQEFRIHVWGNDILDIQEKKKRRATDVDTRIRSYNNGWVFCREGVVCPEAVTDAAVAAVRALSLDFGAVDIGWNQKYEQAAVFEVNTAPGVEGTTLEKYVNKIKEAAQ